MRLRRLGRRVGSRKKQGASSLGQKERKEWPCWREGWSGHSWWPLCLLCGRRAGHLLKLGMRGFKESSKGLEILSIQVERELPRVRMEWSVWLRMLSAALGVRDGGEGTMKGLGQWNKRESVTGDRLLSTKRHNDNRAVAGKWPSQGQYFSAPLCR